MQIHAEDSTGRAWIRDRKYKFEANPNAYEDPDEAIVEIEEPFCFELYNEIANDLLRDMQKLDEDEIATIRTVTELKFAEDLAPDAFAGFLEPRPQRPLLGRTTALGGRSDGGACPARPRNRLRVHRHAQRVLRRTSATRWTVRTTCGAPTATRNSWHWRKFGGRPATARSSELSCSSAVRSPAPKGDSAVADVAADAAQIAGGLLIVSGIAKGQDIKGHKESLRELAGSLDAEVEPILDEVEGRTLELSGSAETQYAEFRRLLREIFATEVGLPLDADGVAPTTQDP